MTELALFWIAVTLMLALVWRAASDSTLLDWSGHTISYTINPLYATLVVDGQKRAKRRVPVLGNEDPALTVALAVTIDGLPLIIYRDGNIVISGKSVNGFTERDAVPAEVQDLGEQAQLLSALRQVVDDQDLIDELEGLLDGHLAMQGSLATVRLTADKIRSANPELGTLLDGLERLLPTPAPIDDTVSRVEAAAEVAQLERQQQLSGRRREVE